MDLPAKLIDYSEPVRGEPRCMTAGAAKVFRIVEYSRDKGNMERVPLAVLACLAGVFFLAYVYPRPAGAGILRAFLVRVAKAAAIAATHLCALAISWDPRAICSERSPAFRA